jgi:intraflagellar transport protein 88
MTSIRAAGYTSHGKPGTAGGLNQFGVAQGPAPDLDVKKNTTPEDIAKDKEKEVNTLLEESAISNSQKKFALALEKAKEAAKKERGLVKHRETNNLMDQVNVDLTYAVCFNLANQYQANDMYNEALNTYSLIVKNKQYSQSGRLRVNMGNIYYKQKKYPSAIKMYRMALDQIPQTGKELRFKIMRNIGNAFVKMGNYQDAITSFEHIMEGRPDFQTAFNLIICHFASGDKDKMKRWFTRMLSIKEAGMDMAEQEEEQEEEEEETGVDDEDELKNVIKERRREITQYIVQAAKLIAPKIEKTFVEGFDHVIEQLRTFKEYRDIASDMEISKAIYFLKQKNVEEAKKTLLAFDKKDHAEHDATTLSRAHTNLCFIYFLEGDLKNADKYGTDAIGAEKGDRYNAKALVNKANCLMQSGKNDEEKEHYDHAREKYAEAQELYMEGIGVEADCVEAIFNLGLCKRTVAGLEQRLGNMEEYKKNLKIALGAFEKLYSILPESPECNFNIATIYDELSVVLNPPEGAECLKKAATWYKRLIAQVKSDAGVLARYGNLLAREDDETMAFNILYDSYRYYPVDMDVISWLGAYFVKSEMYEKAMEYFQKAAQIQPKEVKWMLMVASCHRRIGAYQQALKTYEDIESKHPDNIECLGYLIRICKELGMRDKAEIYQKKLAKAENQVQFTQARMTQQRVEEQASNHHAGFQDSSSGGGRGNYQGYGEFGGMQDMGNTGGRGGERIDTDSVADMVVAERASKGGGKVVVKKGHKDDEDDWGGDELGDDLLPGM